MVRHDRPSGLVQAQQLPAHLFIAHATAANLPDPHDSVGFFGEADSVDFDRPEIAIILKLKDVPGLQGLTGFLDPHIKLPVERNEGVQPMRLGRP